MTKMTRVESFLAGQGLGSRIAYWIARVAVYGFCRLWTRVEVDGRENVPATGPFVLAPVHRSNMDTPFASCVTRRRLRFMGKDTLWKRQPAWAGSCRRSADSRSPGAPPTGRR